MSIHLRGLFSRRTFIWHVSCLSTLFLVQLTIWPSVTDACSRLLWNKYNDEVIVGRTMDWSKPLGDTLYIVPRGIQVTGGTHKNPMTWNTKYGSVVSSIPTWLKQQDDRFTLDDGALDGMNEKGLAAHALFLVSSTYEKRDVTRPGVSTMRWIHYLLNNFSTVNEALIGMEKIQIVPSKIANHPMNFHVTIEDKSGDSAIIEFIDGKQTVQYGPQFTVMTNSPKYETQRKNLSRYRTFGGTNPLPGNITSTDRFVRLKYFSEHLPQSNGNNMGVHYVLSAMRTAVSPFGAPYPDGSIYPTWWVSLSDLKNGIYYYDSLQTLNMIWVELATIDFSKGSGVRWLNPRRTDISGKVNDLFKTVERTQN